MARPVVHFEIMGGDGSQLQAFYRQLFDWTIDADNEWNYGMVSAPEGEGIGGGIGPGFDGISRVTVYVQVPNLRAALDQATALGGTTVMEPMDVGDFAIAQFRDPAGNVVGLVKG